LDTFASSRPWRFASGPRIRRVRSWPHAMRFNASHERGHSPVGPGFESRTTPFLPGSRLAASAFTDVTSAFTDVKEFSTDVTSALTDVKDSLADLKSVKAECRFAFTECRMVNADSRDFLSPYWPHALPESTQSPYTQQSGVLSRAPFGPSTARPEKLDSFRDKQTSCPGHGAACLGRRACCTGRGACCLDRRVCCPSRRAVFPGTGADSPGTAPGFLPVSTFRSRKRSFAIDMNVM